MKRVFVAVGIVGFTLFAKSAFAQREGPGFSHFGNPQTPPPPTRPTPIQLPPVQPNEVRRTFYSQPQWSAEGNKWSGWYIFVTEPAPDGYVFSSETHDLQGDRWCGAWAICEFTGQAPDGRLYFRFRMQGHDENAFHLTFKSIDRNGVVFEQDGKAAASRLAVTVTYRKNKDWRPGRPVSKRRPAR